MFVCTTVLYEYMNLLGNDVYNLFVYTHVRIKIYQEFYHSIIYIANEGHHVRIKVMLCASSLLIVHHLDITMSPTPLDGGIYKYFVSISLHNESNM